MSPRPRSRVLGVAALITAGLLFVQGRLWDQPLPTDTQDGTAGTAARTPAPAPSRAVVPLVLQLAEVEAGATIKADMWGANNAALPPLAPADPQAAPRPHERPFDEDRVLHPRPLRRRCPKAVRPDAFCTPNLGRDWNATSRVLPLSYALPSALFVAAPPPKDQDCSVLVPREKATYRFNTEEDYRHEYGRSYYCITHKKGGWDALRHYEIIAAGCMPFFLDLEYCPEDTMVHLPKRLLLEARRLPGVHFDCARLTVAIDHAVFPKARYMALLRRLIAHGRRHLTTAAMARYVLRGMGIDPGRIPTRPSGMTIAALGSGGNATGPPMLSYPTDAELAAEEVRQDPALNHTGVVPPHGARTRANKTVADGSARAPRGGPPKVLLVTRAYPKLPLNARGNYNSWTLMHGMREVLGADAVDSHYVNFLYEHGEGQRDRLRSKLYGKGFGYGFRMRRAPVNRKRLKQRVQAQEFDLVIYLDPVTAARASAFWLWDTVMDAYGGGPGLGFVHPPDLPSPPREIFYNLPLAYEHATVFQREVPDCTYYAPPLGPPVSPDLEAAVAAARGRAPRAWADTVRTATARAPEALLMKRCVQHRNANCFDDNGLGAAVAAARRHGQPYPLALNAMATDPRPWNRTDDGPD